MALVLIVDDSALSRKAVQAVASADGHSTIEAGNGKIALDLTGEHNPDCMVLDLLMPEVDGLEVLEELHKQGNTMPVIVSTADIQETTRSRCIELGAVAFLNKPPRQDKLREALRLALDRKEGAPDETEHGAG